MLPAEVGCDAQITQDYWMEIRHIVRRIYRENMPLESESGYSSIGSASILTLSCQDTLVLWLVY